METQNNKSKKPILLRTIFILNGILIFLPFIFYYLITTNKLNVGLDPKLILYTAMGYILSFAFMVFFILKRKFMGFRLVFIATFLMSLPSQAYIGILVAIISLALSFHKKIRAYFNS